MNEKAPHTHTHQAGEREMGTLLVVVGGRPQGVHEEITTLRIAAASSNLIVVLAAGRGSLRPPSGGRFDQIPAWPYFNSRSPVGAVAGGRGLASGVREGKLELPPIVGRPAAEPLPNISLRWFCAANCASLMPERLGVDLSLGLSPAVEAEVDAVRGIPTAAHPLLAPDLALASCFLRSREAAVRGGSK